MLSIMWRTVMHLVGGGRLDDVLTSNGIGITLGILFNISLSSMMMTSPREIDLPHGFFVSATLQHARQD